MTKIAVTGCAGFVGSWICEKAISAGYNVIGIDNLSSGVNYTPKQVDFYEKDVNSDISFILKDADFVIHAAAKAELRHNWDNKSEREALFKNNEMATISVLEQMPNVPIIFLSTAAVYGSLSHINNSILKEEDANSSTVESPYAASKLACEAYMAAWSYKRKNPWYILRLVNQVGARTHRGVITDFYNMIKKNNHIHAADNGQQRKNWVHVEDTADLIINIIKNQDIPSGIYTVSSEERWSWLDIVNVMREMYIEKYGSELGLFSLTYENKLAGSIGDPINLYVSSKKLNTYFSCKKSIKNAVRDALLFIGW